MIEEQPSEPQANVPPGDAPANRTGAREAALTREPSRVRRLLKLLGPGLIAGASDDDPATIGTCANVGASVTKNHAPRNPSAGQRQSAASVAMSSAVTNSA